MANNATLTGKTGSIQRTGSTALKHRALCLVAVAAFTAGTASAQPSPTPALDIVPDKLAFDIPYGAPIALDRAQAVIAAAMAETKKRDWKMAVSVMDSGGNLVAFARMDGAQLSSIAISEHKARAAVMSRRETKIYENAIQGGLTYQLTLDGVMASRGGVPLVEDGKLIGAVGCSGGAGSQDEVCAKAGAALLSK
jgi:glc operon protein GlcG